MEEEIGTHKRIASSFRQFSYMIARNTTTLAVAYAEMHYLITIGVSCVSHSLHLMMRIRGHVWSHIKCDALAHTQTHTLSRSSCVPTYLNGLFKPVSLLRQPSTTSDVHFPTSVCTYDVFKSTLSIDSLIILFTSSARNAPSSDALKFSISPLQSLLLLPLQVLFPLPAAVSPSFSWAFETATLSPSPSSLRRLLSHSLSPLSSLVVPCRPLSSLDLCLSLVVALWLWLWFVTGTHLARDTPPPYYYEYCTPRMNETVVTTVWEILNTHIHIHVYFSCMCVMSGCVQLIECVCVCMYICMYCVVVWCCVFSFRQGVYE